MAKEHDVLRRVMRPGAETATHDWHTVLHSAHKVSARQSAESEAVLAEVLKFDGQLRLAGNTMPHAMSAADMLRSLAIQTLARWDHRRHRAAIQRIHASTRSDLLAEIARAHL